MRQIIYHCIPFKCWFSWVYQSLKMTDRLQYYGLMLIINPQGFRDNTWWHQAITWTNHDLSLVRLCGLHLRAFYLWVPSLIYCITRLNIVLSKFLSNRPGPQLMEFQTLIHWRTAGHCPARAFVGGAPQYVCSWRQPSMATMGLEQKNTTNVHKPPNDAIWRHRSGSTLAQVMACCLKAPSHYLNQCWLIISKVSRGIHTRAIS